MKLIESYLPVFTGFYGTIFEEDGAIESALDNDDLLDVDFDLIEWDYGDYMERVAQRCVSSIWNYLKNDGFKINIKFQKVYSPREYNFKNDEIHCAYVISDKDFDKLVQYCKDNLTEFQQYLENRFSSRPGFSSYFDTDTEKWFEDYLNSGYEDDGFASFEVAVMSVLEFYLFNEGYDKDSMYDDVVDEMYIGYEIPDEIGAE